MIFDLLGLVLEYLSLKSDRRNALKIKRTSKPLVTETVIYKTKLENTFKDYNTIFFPFGEIDSSKSESIIWHLDKIENSQNIATFRKEHKTSMKPKKMKLSQKFANEYPSITIKPHTKLDFEININSKNLEKKIYFEVAFRRKLLNSTIHINMIKI